jgi:hypothetical protein
MTDLVLSRLALERIGQHVGQRLEEVEVAGVVLAYPARCTPSTPNGPAGPSMVTLSIHSCGEKPRRS